MISALVLRGDGLNCEEETAEAFRLAGFEPVVKHINDLVAEKVSHQELLEKYAVLALPGGFSFGDHLDSGKVLALKMRFQLQWDLNDYAKKGGLVIGICNGFQTLIRLGVFGKEVSMAHNSSGKFTNEWVRLQVTYAKDEKQCVWLAGIEQMTLPVRNGEGRLVFEPRNRMGVLSKLQIHHMDCLRYEINPNGSDESLAGLSDSTGRILGLMPHPEAFVRWTAHPEWTAEPNRGSASGEGLKLFENAFQEATLRTQSPLS